MHGTPRLVGDVMTRTVVALGRTATFKDIVKAMRQWKVSALPVVEEENRVVGVVSEADLLRKEEYRDGDHDRRARLERLSDLVKAGAVTAEELMTAPAVTVGAGATLGQAARTMARSGVKRLPVVSDDGALLGIVSRSDLLKVFLRDDEDIAEEVRDEIVAHLFPAPPEPASPEPASPEPASPEPASPEPAPPESAPPEPASPASAPPKRRGPESREPVRVEVHDGVVRLTGRIPDTSLVPVVTRLVRGVEGVVDVECALAGPPRRPDLDPDLPADDAAHGMRGAGSLS
ncbi:CBS domain-containing protein [Streptomyces sp. NPDC052040]|uniref:CBS domain-containing protein n=1 Tax=Streptomyces sp. NPDC052040 TaxID=3365682 RepID=UPI0037D94A17